MATQSFARSAVAAFFEEGARPLREGWVQVAKLVIRKLDRVDYAAKLADLASPPGDRLEALKGGRVGFYSIRINDHYRVVFRWTESGPADVDIVDYH
ncbi:MAG TPA: type II toxin-antitoxin system RelE/ParE family toxin [Thermoanaerobaculia bacterium]|nr:type II toxin-antitoxin system RelE/ParE family toxin [Thermoanaerobaculia bacterium]